MTAKAAVEVPWASAGAAGPSAKKAKRYLSAASPTWCVTPSSLDTVLPRGRKMGSDRLERSQVASFGNAFVRGLEAARRAIRFGQTNCYRRHGGLPQDLDHEVECFFGDLRLCFGMLRPNVGVS